MCGRYTITMSLEELMLRFMIGEVRFDYEPRYNVAPGQLIPAIIEADGKKRQLGPLRWGLIPSWAKDEKTGYKTINAKAETVREKPSFRPALERRRCIIPADGFYEWRVRGGVKEPMRITLKGDGLFAMAGLYEMWTALDGRRISSCTILTTEPNDLMRDIHNRMPVILRPGDESVWLDRGLRDVDRLAPLLAPYPAKEMRAYRVDPKVGNVKNESPDCIEAFDGDGDSD